MATTLKIAIAIAMTIAIAIGGASSAPANAQTPASQPLQLPTLGNDGALSTGAERQLGNTIIRQLYRDPDYIDDPVLVEYVQTQWHSLLAAARTRGELSPELDERFAWEVLLGKDRSINAFALPGGYLGVHLGLIGVVGTKDELASVLAHELSHITQRHIARLIEQQGKHTPMVIGAMILGALAASKNPQAAQALVVGGQAALMQTQLNFSRDMEREADRVGYNLMAPAGFSPQGFVGMFEKLQQAHRINDNGSWPYLRSHPLTTQRIADMQSRHLHTGATETPTLEHALLAARARVLSNPPADLLRQWQTEPQSTGFAALPLEERASKLYAAALAASQWQDSVAAHRLWSRLQSTVAVQGDASAQRQIQLLAAEIALKAGDAELALRQLPNNTNNINNVRNAGAGRPELFLRAQALLRLGRTDEITSALQTWVATHPRDAGAWQILASAWQAQGQILRAVRAEAEAHAAHYDYPAAVDRLKAGQDLARLRRAPEDFVEASIIDTRLHMVQTLLRQQMAQR